MKKAFVAMWVVLILAVTGAFLKQLAGSAGLPNLVPVIRDPLLIGFGLWGAGRLDLLAARRWAVLIGLISLFLAAYVSASMFEDRLFAGLYYVRIYLLPIIFFVGALGLFSTVSPHSLRTTVRVLVAWNAVLLVIALPLYGFLVTTPTLRPLLFGGGLLPTAWFISGGTWMRMGLPAVGPNSLGIVLALNAFVFITLLMQSNREPESDFVSKPVLLASLLGALFGLVLTFSRSSWLLLGVGAFLLPMASRHITFKRLSRFLFVGLCSMIVLVLFTFLADLFSDGYVALWLELNLNFEDPSLMGHAVSFRDAFDDLDRYGLWGYPRGSVGPRAFAMAGAVHHVENSFLGIVYDMGLPIASLYFAAVGVLCAVGYRRPAQWPLLIGFLIPFLLLPYVFEPEILFYFSFIYLLVGQIAPQREARVPAAFAQPFAGPLPA